MRQGFDGQKTGRRHGPDRNKREWRAVMDASLEGMAWQSEMRGEHDDDVAAHWRVLASCCRGGVVSVSVWRFESQMAKVLEKFRFGGGISKMA